MVRKRKENEFRQGGWFQRFLTWPARRLKTLVSRREDRIEAKSVTKLSLGYILRRPFVLTIQFFAFVFTSWASSRSGRAFLLGLPALFAVLVLVTGIAGVNAFYQNIVFNRYTGASLASFKNGRYSSALIYLKRLTLEYPSNSDTLFRYGLVRHERDELDQAWSVMSKLAPLSDQAASELNYGPAHQWLASQYLAGEESGFAVVQRISRDERFERAIKHLRQAIALQDYNLNALNQLALAYDRMGDTQSAIRYYSRVVELEFPPGADIGRNLVVLQYSQTPRLVELLAEAGKGLDALRYASQAERRLKLLTDRYPDDIQAWALIIRSQIAAGQDVGFQAAQQTLRLAFQRTRNPRTQLQLRLLMADLLLQAANQPRPGASGKDLFLFKFKLISNSLLLYVERAETIDALIKLTLVNGVPDEIDDWLIEGIFQGDVNRLTGHLVRGCREALDDNLKAAISQFEIATKINRQAHLLLNSILIRLSTETHQAAEQALKISQATLANWPDNPAFHLSRGAALLELSRHREAIEELELARESMDSNLIVHQILARAYDAANQPEKAQQMRDAMDRILEEQRAQKAAAEESTPENGRAL